MRSKKNIDIRVEDATNAGPKINCYFAAVIEIAAAGQIGRFALSLDWTRLHFLRAHNSN